MSQKILNFDVNNAIPLKNPNDIKEELQTDCYPDNKVCVSEATINIGNTELNEYMRNDVDDIKTDLPSFEINNIVRNNVNIEDGTYPADTCVEFCNELLSCNHCYEVYQDYCTKCRVLVHILNEKPYNTYNTVRELPKYMLESRESLGRLGIFALKVIPENIRFGPFTGLSSTGLSLRIKGGKFVVSSDKLELLNWMQYINPARNIYEGNLFPFQCENGLYYYSTRRIQEGEELLVYFGEAYEDNLLKSIEMDFVPITKEDVKNVFACTSCCLGFRSKEFLAEHKAVYHDETNEMFCVEELVQCPFCKIYLGAKEYSEHHMDNCSETKVRHCVFLPPEVHGLEVGRRSSVRSKTKSWKRGIYKCTRCKFSTMYNADFRYHTNQHYEVKMYKCGICDSRYKAKRSLEAHVKKMHADSVGRDVQKYSTCDYFKTNIKRIKERCSHSSEGAKQCSSSKCKLQTRGKCHLKSLINVKHLNRGKYKCENCKFKTYYRTYLQMHMKIKHFMESNYKCAECNFETSYKASLERHIKVKHLTEKDYSCAECEFKTNYKTSLELHIKTIHLKVSDYKCAQCEYKTNFKSHLKGHVKTKHLKEHDYKCMDCEYKTNYKSHFKIHVKTRHLKERDYNCMECEFKTYYKSRLKIHVKTKHLNEHDFKCTKCDFKTNFKSNLGAHVKGKHLKEHDYKCVECEYKTNFNSDLQKHIRAKHLKENDFKCMECEFKTSYKSELKLHVKTKHLKEHDYKCMECEYMTNRKPDLLRHRNAKHLKDNDYKCMQCEYKTNYKSDLQKHIKAKHLKENDN